MNKKNWKEILLGVFGKFELFIVLVLAFFIALVVLSSTLELSMTILKSLSQQPFFHLGLDQLLDIFGLFLMILLGLELLEIVKAYLRDDVFHVEVVMIVAIIAISRKVIVLDIKNYAGSQLIGLALILSSLVGGFFLLKKLFPNGENKANKES